MKNHSSARSIIGVALACALLLGIQTSAADKKRPPETSQSSRQPSQLIWPLPPDPPRIRWLAEYMDMARVKNQTLKKRGWLDKVTGSKTPEERRMELKKPYGIATDSKGRIFVADTQLCVVFVVNPATGDVERLEGSGRAPMGMPVGIAIDAEDRLFVSDALMHSITCFSPTGSELARFGSTTLSRPGGIAIDRQRKRLYVADAKDSRIAVFDIRSFGFIGYFGAAGKPGHPEKDSLAGPSNVAVDQRGNIYVADTLNCRVLVLDPAGKYLRAFGTQGDRPGEFIRPKGIALDSEGHVYVADAEFNNFQIFSPEGQPLLAVGAMGSAPGEFGLIAGLHIDSANRIYTTEMYVGRIQVFQYISQPPPPEEKGGGRQSLSAVHAAGQ